MNPSYNLALLVVCDPQTKPEVLENLSRHESPGVVRAVAQNPNTPLSCLLSLATQFPREVFENPSVPLLLLEQPDLFSLFSSSAVLSFLGLPELSAPWLEGFVQTPTSTNITKNQLLAHIAAHPNTSSSLQEKIVESGFSSLRKYTNETDGAILDALIMKSGFEEVLLSIARHPAATSSFLEEALQCCLPKVRMAAAKHPKAPQELLTLLRSAGASQSLEHIEPRDGCSAFLLSRLSHMGEFARFLAASHPALPRSLHGSLLVDNHGEVRAALASRSDLKAFMYERLISDSYPPVRVALAKNARVPSLLLECLATDEDISVALALCANDNTPAEAFFSMEQQHPRKHRVELLQAFAESKALPGEVLESFAVSEDSGLRALAANHSNTPKELLSLLRRAGSDDQLQSIQVGACDTSLKAEELSSLASLGYFGELLAAQHPNTDETVLRGLVERYLPFFQPKGCTGLHLVPNERFTAVQVLKRLATNPNTPADLLLQIFSVIPEISCFADLY